VYTWRWLIPKPPARERLRVPPEKLGADEQEEVWEVCEPWKAQSSGRHQIIQPRRPDQTRSGSARRKDLERSRDRDWKFSS
jgi:hypothetical protein